MQETVNKPINIFIIYAREDKEIKQRLLLHLNLLKSAYNLNIWHDDYIEPGEEWKPSIDSRLAKTDLFLLLVSVDFMNSEFIHQVEFKYAIDRHKAHNSIMIPIIIKFCQWDVDISFEDYTFSLSELQVLPDEAQPIDGWKTTEEAYNNIAGGIRKVLTSIKNKSAKDSQDQKETLFWENAVTQNTISAYQEYLGVYDHGRFEREALKNIDKLKNIEAANIEAANIEAAKREAEKREAEIRKHEDEKNKGRKSEGMENPKRRFSFKLSIFVSFALIGIILSVILFTNKSHIDNSPQPGSIESKTDPPISLPENTSPDFRDLCSRTVQTDDLTGKSCYELDIMRNTIYAVHGYTFKKNKMMMDFFNKQVWYKPSNDFSFNTSLSDMERDNVNTIRNYEDQKNCPK